MARARNIKPAFFTNEIIGTLDPIVGLTFIGLWCLADKDGRLEDRPLRIKAELFPYREGTDVNGYLTELERTGFIDRYEVDGKRYIQITNFEKHQSPHHTEKAKGYPSKPAQNKGSSDLTVKQQLQDGKQKVPTRSDSLIPDSLIPEYISSGSTIPTVSLGELFDNQPITLPNKTADCPHSEILALWAEKLPTAIQPADWNEKRQQALRSRWREKSNRQKLDWWSGFFEFIEKSDFLMGRTNTPGRKAFALSLDWLCKSENFLKVIEGRFHEQQQDVA